MADLQSAIAAALDPAVARLVTAKEGASYDAPFFLGWLDLCRFRITINPLVYATNGHACGSKT